jgi:hypothetical protein
MKKIEINVLKLENKLASKELLLEKNLDLHTNKNKAKK